MAPTPRPRLFLDIDGVINAPHPPWSETTTFTVTDNQGAGYAVNYTVTVAPAMVAEIDQLRADHDVELVILSSWLENSAMIFDLAMALDALHGPRLLTIPPRKLSGWRSPTWKRNAILGDLGDLGDPVPYIWVDDEEVSAHGAFVKAAVEVPSLMIAPDPNYGLTPGHLEAIRAFLEAS